METLYIGSGPRSGRIEIQYGCSEAVNKVGAGSGSILLFIFMALEYVQQVTSIFPKRHQRLGGHESEEGTLFNISFCLTSSIVNSYLLTFFPRCPVIEFLHIKIPKYPLTIAICDVEIALKEPFRASNHDP